MKTILYIGTFDFPNGNASAIRVLGIGKALKEAGYNVKFLGKNLKRREKDKLKEDHYEYEGFQYYSQNHIRNNNVLSKFHKNYVSFSKVRQIVEEIGIKNVEAIILYHHPTPAALRIKKWCDKNSIKTIADTTEWYNVKKQLKGKIFSFKALDSIMRMYYTHRKINNLITISSYLENYYIGKECHTVRVPILSMNKGNIESSKNKTNRILKFIYAGSPTKKDLLNEIIEACINLSLEKYSYEFHIFGLSKSEAIKTYNYKDNKYIPDEIIFHGRVEHEVLVKKLPNYDFSLLLRPVERYSSAGFPTKFVESLSFGIPVISNLTSDLEKYLNDGVNGFVVKGDTAKELTQTLKRSFLLNENDLIDMKMNAYSTATSDLHYSNFSIQLEKFISDIKK